MRISRSRDSVADRFGKDQKLKTVGGEKGSSAHGKYIFTEIDMKISLKSAFPYNPLPENRPAKSK